MIMGWEISVLDTIRVTDVFGYCHSLIYWLSFENAVLLYDWE